MTLNKEGLEAAHAAYERYGHTGDLRTQRLSDGCVSAVITAYLAAVSNSEERRRRAAGPSEVKWPMPDPLKKYKDAALPAPNGLVERLLKLATAADGSSSGAKEALREAATFIQTLQRERDELAYLHSERDQGDKIVNDRLSAAERQVRDMREGQREAFMLWVRAWAKKRFGVWITHNTAKGAFAEYQESARLLLKEGGE